MNKKALDKLVKKLGMEVELAPILNSTGGYERFERSINNLLSERIQEIYPESTKYNRVYKINIVESFPGDYKIYLKTVEDFKKAYGIDCEAKLQKEVAEKRGVGKAAVSCLTCRLIRRLSRPTHKKKIWYNSL